MSIELLLGTYTRRISEGIYSVHLNSRLKKLEHLSLIAKVGSPTYVAQTDKQNTLFTIVSEEDKGGIATLIKDTHNHYIRESELLNEGASPAYIAYDENRQFIYTSNYHKGEVAVYGIADDGNIKLLDCVAHTGSSVHENQASPHAHYSDLTPDQKYLAVCDLGTDEVYTYAISETGKLAEKARLKVKPGSGPRHLAFHPNGRIAYLVAELSSELIVLEYNSNTGEFHEIQTISSIPKEHVDFNSGAAVRVTTDGKFVYASNRGHDSIAIFSTEKDGQLTLVEYVPSEGETPRDFNLDPSEKFLIVGHQDSDNLTLFERDTDTGLLKLLQKDFYAPEVVNVTY